jgi:hypothetical protein
MKGMHQGKDGFNLKIEWRGKEETHCRHAVECFLSLVDSYLGDLNKQPFSYEVKR